MGKTKTNWSRREFLSAAGLTAASAALPGIFSACKPLIRPNIIFILADDLGYGELGCYGQEKILTPNIDKMAAEGIRFTQHYSGSPVCAPSRCTLLTGLHTGHAFIRDNDEMSELGDVWSDPSIEGQRPLPSGTETIGTLMKKAGYVTGAVGKWGLGGPGTSGEPNRQGFDFWYGYLCQRQAHNYYPTHLWKNREKELLEGNDYFSPHQKFPEESDPNDPQSYLQYSRRHYAPDLMTEEALDFIRKNRKSPFFLYLAYPIPHAALQVPNDSLDGYKNRFSETPYLGEQGYLPHSKPRSAYAAMITRMDDYIGRILDLLKELGLDRETLVLFSSDNGPTFNGGTDSEFFRSSGSFQGLKGSVWEGGICVPLIARYPGRIPSGSISAHVSAFWDMLPTFCELAGTPIPDGCDGISIAPLLSGNTMKRTHDYLYWEFRAYGGQQAVRMGDWKAVRRGLRQDNSDTTIKLFNLKEDVGESTDVAAENPEIVHRIKEIMQTARIESERFPFPEIHSRRF